MPDLFYLIAKWKKQIAAVVLLSLAVVTAAYFLRPARYLSVATALPANSYLADKSHVFSENIQGLYSVLGTADELDMIIGTGQLDTVYLSVTDAFRLQDHYKISDKKEMARYKAATMLKKNTKVQRSEYGELKVKVRDKDKQVAAALANAIMQTIQEIHGQLQNANNKTILNNLIAGRVKLHHQLQNDSTASDIDRQINSQGIWHTQLQQYEKLIGQYQLMADSKTEALLIVENARPAASPDRPKLWQVLLATFFLSLIFALLAALVLERGKTSPK